MAGSSSGLETSMTGAVASWGVQQDVRTGIKRIVSGIVLGWDKNGEFVEAPCHNEVGSRIGSVIYDLHRSGTANIQVGASTEVPNIGTVVNIKNVQFIVKGGRVTESNQDWRKIALQLEAWGYKFVPVEADNNFDNRDS